MYEVVAVLAGILIGAALPRRSSRAFLVLAVPLCLAVGFAVSALSGELQIAVEFLFFDVGQTLLAAILTALALQALESRRARHS